jgi:uncharacterized protein (UPF0333 family)
MPEPIKAAETVVDTSTVNDNTPLPGAGVQADTAPSIPAGHVLMSEDELNDRIAEAAEAAANKAIEAVMAKAKKNGGNVEAPKPVGPKSKSFVRVTVTGTIVEAINKHVSNIVQFEQEVNMPSDYTMGDLKRSLPNKLARTNAAFKRLRSVESHKVVGPALQDKKTGKVASDYVLPRKLPQQIASSHINKAEGLDGEEDGGEVGIGKVGDTTEYGPDGLPPITR